MRRGIAFCVTVAAACGGLPAPPPSNAPPAGEPAPHVSRGNASLPDASLRDASLPEAADRSDAAGAADAASPPAFAFDATIPGGRKLRVFGLGRAACDPAATVRRFTAANEGSCTVLEVKSARASGDVAAPAAAAFDGNACTIWNAGAAASQAIEGQLELGDHVTAMILVPEMTPAKGHSVHVVELALGGTTARRLVADATFTSNDAYLVVIDAPPAADRVRIVTTESESWVAWREIILLRCDGQTNIPRGVTELTPPPARKIVVGKGACKVDSDCAPDACCGSRTCLARSMAPRCEGVGCGQGCGGDNMACGRGSCVCDRGTCGAWYHGIVRGLQ